MIRLRLRLARRAAAAAAAALACAFAAAAAPATAAAAPPAFAAYAGYSAAQHQAAFNSYAKSGYRMISLDVSGGRAHAQYSAVWVKRTGPAWVATHGLTRSAFMTWMSTWSAKGYRTLLLSASGRTVSDAVFAGVMVKDNVAATTYPILTPGSLIATVKAKRKAGYRLIQLAPYGTAASPYYAAAFAKISTPVAYGYSVASDAARHQEVFTGEVNQWARPVEVDPSDDLRYAAIWQDDSIGPWVARHGLTDAALRTEISKWRGLGYYPVSLHAGGYGSATRYAAIFAKTETPTARRWTVTGTAAPALAGFDNYMKTFMTSHGVRAAALAVAKDGRLAFARGYTWAIPGYPLTQPTSLFRIASLTKPLTSLTLLRLISQGKAKESDRLQLWLNLKSPKPPYLPKDPRLYSVLVAHVMVHAGGFPRDLTAPQDQVAAALGKSVPITKQDMATYMTGQMLDFFPGTDYQYSNYGYSLLGLLIEKLVPAKSYFQVLTDQVLKPLNITRARLARTLYAHRAPGEVRYHTSDLALMRSWRDPKRPLVSWPYGENIEIFDSFGGLLMSPIDYARIFAGVFDMGSQSPVANAQVLSRINAPMIIRGVRRYRTWGVSQVGGKLLYTHNGALAGVRSIAVHRSDGLSIVAMANGDYMPSSGALLAAADAVKSWPADDLFPRYNLPSLLPDLRVTKVAAYPGPGRVVVTARICNFGRSVGGPVEVGVYRHRTTAPSCGATPDIKGSFPSLGAGLCASGSYLISGVSPGSYKAWAFVDPGCKVKELVEGNNTASVSYTIKPQKPNLYVRSFTTKVTGNTATLSFSLCHAGPSVSPYRVKLWVNASGTPACTTADPLIDGTVSMAEVPANSCTPFNLDFDITDVPGGSYKLDLMTDAGCSISETYETDNLKTAWLSIPKPDLSIGTFTAKVSGGTLTYSGTVCNTGHASGEVGVGLYFNRAFPPACSVGPDDGVILANIAPGTCRPVTLSYSVAGAPAGTYRSWLFADALCTIAEGSETNNTASATFTLP